MIKRAGVVSSVLCRCVADCVSVIASECGGVLIEVLTEDMTMCGSVCVYGGDCAWTTVGECSGSVLNRFLWERRRGLTCYSSSTPTKALSCVCAK